MTSARAGQLIAAEAKRHRRKRYSMRGIGPRSFNCAGLSYYVVKQSLDVDISYFLNVQYKEGDAVSRRGIQPGDLVFFKGTDGKKKGPTHVGIALSNSVMIHAANLKEDVKIDRINKYRKHYLGARRLDPAKYFA